METEIKLHLEQLDAHLQHAFSLSQSMSETEFHQQPSDSSWSVCQVFEHILQSETGTLGYMLKKSSSGWDALENEGDEQAKNGQALSQRLLSDEKYKAPAILPEPPNTTSFAQFEIAWPQLRRQLTEFVLSVDPKYHNKLVFKQPFAGMLTLSSTTAFLANHFKHHLPQIQTILHTLRQ
jgi:hypothetical protein